MDPLWLTMRPKKKYAYTTGRRSALVHRIRWVKSAWIGGAFSHAVIETKCSQAIIPERQSVVMCDQIPPFTVPCAYCHGKGRNFPRRREPEIPFEVAKGLIQCAARKAS